MWEHLGCCRWPFSYPTWHSPCWMLPVICFFFCGLWSRVWLDSTTDLNAVDGHFPIQHGTPHVGCFLSFAFYFADPLLLPPSTHPPFHSFHTRHAPPRHRLLLFVVAAGFRSLFSGQCGSDFFEFMKEKTVQLNGHDESQSIAGHLGNMIISDGPAFSHPIGLLIH